MAFQYPYLSATHMPSKQTATDRKGRDKDLEASENAPEVPVLTRKWRSPSFKTSAISGKEFGNVMHTVMQYIPYENCTDEAAISLEVKKLVEKGFLTPEQGSAVDPGKLNAFFSSEIGSQIRSGITYLREFKFSILDQGTNYDPELVGEEVLLQGVVDCALIEEDGITVIDFKTDYVTEDTISAVVSRYSEQIRTYAHALQRIYEKPIKARYLYLFGINRFVAV